MRGFAILFTCQVINYLKPTCHSTVTRKPEASPEALTGNHNAPNTSVCSTSELTTLSLAQVTEQCNARQRSYSPVGAESLVPGWLLLPNILSMPACYSSYGTDCCCMCHANLAPPFRACVAAPAWFFFPWAAQLALVCQLCGSSPLTACYFTSGRVFCAGDGSPLALSIVLVLEVSVSACCVPINSPLS